MTATITPLRMSSTSTAAKAIIETTNSWRLTCHRRRISLTFTSP
jgi:hypothetical protein